MLNNYKAAYTNKNIHFVFVNYEGIIQESDQLFIDFKIGDSILNAHPFFECLPSLKEVSEEEITFNCVHLNIADKDYNCDIKIASKKEGVLIVITDLTEHYAEYQKIAQSRNESIINNELIVLKNSELEERERFKNSFIQNFSHELRNPLTSIISITNIIGDTQLTNEQRRMLDFLKESNNNLKLMLEDILSISMINSGKLQLESKYFNFPQLLELLKFTYQTRAENKGLDFTITSDVKIPEFLEGDRLRLFQVLTNLLDNAFKYTLNGSISLNISLNQKRANKISLHFAISDSGIGIAKKDLPFIFISFNQLETIEKHNGTGLGLAIVKGMLEQMESNIKVQSKLDKGTVFSFDLGLKFPIHPITDLPSNSNTKAYKLKEEGGKYKILLVEDDARLQTTLFKSLIDTEYFYIDLISDGAKVMEEVVNDTYDMILMDVNLPNLNGDQITKTIREFPFKNIKKIPIIGLTANAFETNINSYLKIGMNAVLSKPFDQENLLETMFKFLK